MIDNNNDEEDEETLKRKKIRRILLLKIDCEIKNNNKRNSKIMINSKTIQEINNSYNLYNILLSEKSRIYFHSVETKEKIVSTNIKPLTSYRMISNVEKKKSSHELINCSCEEDSNSLNSPISPVNFYPKKINVGVNRLSTQSKNIEQKNSENKSHNYSKDKVSNYGDKLNKSTKIQKKSLFKLVEKIIQIKMNDDDIEEIIKKSLMKLRKYCNKLRIPKKKIKRINNQKTMVQSKEKGQIMRRNDCPKRLTVVNDKNTLKKPLLENKLKVKRYESRLKTTKHLNDRIRNIQFLKEKEKERKKQKHKSLNKLGYPKMVNEILVINKEKIPDPPPNRKRIRKMQTLNGNIKEKLLKYNKLNTNNKNENSEINKNEETDYSNVIHFSNFNKNTNNNNNNIKQRKNGILSSKNQRPSKLKFLNSNINSSNKNIINRNKESVTVKSKFNTFADKFGKNSNNKSGKKNYSRRRRSTKKKKKNTVKIDENVLLLNKKLDKFELIKLRKKRSFESDELGDMDYLSDYGKKLKYKFG
jgi:hypothetical protein